MTHRTRILIVERDRVAAQALQQTLAGHGYVAGIASSPEQAIELLERDRSVAVDHPVGVVIADQDTAGAGDGFGLIRRLHDDWPAVVPIVLSGFRKVESAVAVMRLGAADYLLKPVVEQELFSAIERAEQRHALLASRDALEPDDEPGDVQGSEDSVELTIEHADGPASGEKGWTPMPLAEAMKDPERRILLQALEHNDWNRQQTAKQLDINRTTLYKKIRQYRLDEPAA